MELFRLGRRRDAAKKPVTAKETPAENDAVKPSGTEAQHTTQINIVVDNSRNVTVASDDADAQRVPDIVVSGVVTEVREEIPAPAEEIVSDEEEEIPAAATEETVPAAIEEEVQDDVPIPDFCEVSEESAPASISGDSVGTIYGNVGTNSFNCRVCGHLERSEYVTVDHEDYGPVLCQVDSLIRKSNLSLEKTQNMTPDTVIKDMVSAHITVIGYRDDHGLLLAPRTTFRAGADVKRADRDFIRKVLGLEINPRTDGYIGLLHGHDLPVALNLNQLLQRHACILAKTGGGKSYVSGDIIEELMKHEVTTMIIDTHGEYGAMKEPGTLGELKFNVTPKGYAGSIKEFAVSNELRTKGAIPLRFTFRTLEAKEILELLEAGDSRYSLPPLKKAIDELREVRSFYSVRDLIDVLEKDQRTRNPVLITELELLDEAGIFSEKGNAVNELIEKGKTTIINMVGTSDKIRQMIVKRLATIAFEQRKKDKIPPMMLVIDEAHNYCPQGTQLISSRPLATIASEGRKFGLGLMVISQRPAKIDKNVLSQCGTQIILKVTNPNDLKAISQSVEGLTNGMTDDIQTMPLGMGLVVGAGIESPLLIEIRPRETRHGGSGVTVLEDSE